MGKFLLSLVSFVFCFQFSNAQMQVSPGGMTVCPTTFDKNVSNKSFKMPTKIAGTTSKSTTPQATFVMNYDAEVSANAQLVTAFEFAADIWAHEITSDVPIVVNVSFQDFSGSTAATSGSTPSTRRSSRRRAPGEFDTDQRAGLRRAARP